MTEHAVDQRKGVPAISQLTWLWALVFTCFTSGLFALGMALHISWWVRNRRKTGVAFYGYLALTLLLIVDLIPDRMLGSSVPWESIGTMGAFLWIANAFVLRRELMLYYASPEGGVLEINPWLTGLLSVHYLNYCLWVVRDSA
jgi:hypothetical protein